MDNQSNPMAKRPARLTFFTLFFALIVSGSGIAHAADPLPSWQEGKAKQSIIEFVTEVTQEGSAEFVPPAERIATFDNDGTLWAEQPAYVQLLFALDRVKTLAPQHPEWQQIGQRPIAAFGNSDGDLQMLQWTMAGDGARFALYVHHTDGEREWAYDRESSIGRLDKGLDQARDDGWTVVDMKEDWKVVYPIAPTN